MPDKFKGNVASRRKKKKESLEHFLKRNIKGRRTKLNIERLSGQKTPFEQNLDKVENEVEKRMRRRTVLTRGGKGR